ncbi:thiol:disulfide interchange protein DsbA/DsbL [Alicycliphilus denitrificans]|uniref:thiol:disulfide interchange protein DsbA/DsbL n=1 Tax=Alicycliphilus denitrificans TaxID=179636 RepID=UPI00384A8B56
MKRREFSLSAAALTAGALALPARAQPREGKDYRKLAKPVATEAPAGKIEVVEFFGYFCPHCNSFEPALNAWLKTAPKDIVLHRVPVNFNAKTVPMQKLYYTLEGLGKLEPLHAQAFRYVHVERKPLQEDAQVLAWAGMQPGLDQAKFKEMYNSFGVANQIRKATQLQQAYDVEGVPSMGVAGRYYVDGTMAGSTDNMLRLVEQLAAQVRKG